ncbi:MAG: glycosyltransferase, partial [Gemmatimonadota bacterium]|nr:glycosyltransferase [Gemmatimonadota bacterium]
GFVGYFGHWVDLDLILETARLCPQHEFVLAGDGPAREGLEARTQEVKNIRFTGVLPHEKVFEEIRLMDLGLIPFKINEVTDRASPVKLFEYWAMGVPVLATACLEIRLVAETAPAGALSFFEGPAELARKIDELAHRPEARRHSRGICLRAVQPYDWKTLGARVEEILKG